MKSCFDCGVVTHNSPQQGAISEGQCVQGPEITSISNDGDHARTMSKADTKLRTRLVFMLKSIVDDEDVEGGLIMIGTLVQTVWDLTEEQQRENFAFECRFNECSAKENMDKRANQAVTVKEKDADNKLVDVRGVRSTYQARIPLEVNSIYNLFPFKIFSATAAIELSSIAQGKTKIRPDFLLHKKDRRSTICIQDLRTGTDKELMQGIGGKLLGDKREADLYTQLMDKIDMTKKYDFLSLYPKVYYQYDLDKKYCPRFVLSFDVLTDGFQALVQIILPLILVTILAVLNVCNDANEIDVYNHSGADAASHLQVSSALTLAVVFILPQILDTGNRAKLFSRSNVFVIVFFVAMVLASIPSSLIISLMKRKVLTTTDNQTPSQTPSPTSVANPLLWISLLPESLGVIIMILSLFYPLWNARQFLIYKRRVRREAKHLTDEKAFVKDETFTKEKKEFKSFDDYFEVIDFLENNEKAKNIDMRMYTRGERGKSYWNLWWSTMTSNGDNANGVRRVLSAGESV